MKRAPARSARLAQLQPRGVFFSMFYPMFFAIVLFLRGQKAVAHRRARRLRLDRRRRPVHLLRGSRTF